MTLTAHAAYLAWSGKAVRDANLAWRRRTPYLGETILSKESLHFHLFKWAVANGSIVDPGARRNKPLSIYVATVFEKDPEAVKAEARAFWKCLTLALAGSMPSDKGTSNNEQECTLDRP